MVLPNCRKSILPWTDSLTLSWLILLLTCVLLLNQSTHAFVTKPSTIHHSHYEQTRSTKSTTVYETKLETTTSVDGETTVSTISSSTTTSITSPRKKRVAVLLCPAQFCVPQDYDAVWKCLPEEIFTDNDNTILQIDRSLSRVVPLSRRDWIKVSKQLPTTDFWNASLQVHKTLDWYFERLEQGLSEIVAQQLLQDSNNNKNNHDELSICLVGHSIGGWVARAYLGGLSRTCSAISQTVRVSSLITLGTPHTSPSSALVDQTRGLLQEIANAPECSSEALHKRNIAVTCVCSSSFPGSFVSTDVEQLVAASSYLPLLGRSGNDVLGDGIVPLDLAFMEAPAKRVVLTDDLLLKNASATSTTDQPKRRIRHSHVLPTPWNLWDGYAPSIPLDESAAVSYVSPEVVPLWSRYIR
ncbi:PGAP1-like protein [Nitzschia inconspicua]|uniref:PGAP1-like protein n=1 Tax=Nitzschia inconspicua TaxID=303405 RepID=A0A9K3L8U2_9STRA|nr:PGAP1-like protein [Nitzschia inconspicua]